MKSSDEATRLKHQLDIARALINSVQSCIDAGIATAQNAHAVLVAAGNIVGYAERHDILLRLEQ